MGFINVFIQSNASISIKNNQLMLKNEKNEMSYPLEDINSVMIDNVHSNISLDSISAFAQYDIVVFFCDKRHLPTANLIPINSHFRQLNIYNKQVEAPKPLIKRLWQAVIKSKIHNQALSEKYCELKYDEVESLVEQVQSGDVTNIESVAASKHFKIMFGKCFSRRADNNINAMLNYGYAILRGMVARTIVSRGLLPLLGLQHKNTFNSYNLADDLMEPIRPVVDLFVYNNKDSELDTQMKAQIFNLINTNVKVAGQNFSVSYAIEKMVDSFVNSLKTEEIKIQLPEILPLEMHRYE